MIIRWISVLLVVLIAVDSISSCFVRLRARRKTTSRYAKKTKSDATPFFVSERYFGAAKSGGPGGSGGSGGNGGAGGGGKGGNPDDPNYEAYDLDSQFELSDGDEADARATDAPTTSTEETTQSTTEEATTTEATTPAEQFHAKPDEGGPTPEPPTTTTTTTTEKPFVADAATVCGQGCCRAPKGWEAVESGLELVLGSQTVDTNEYTGGARLMFKKGGCADPKQRPMVQLANGECIDDKKKILLWCDGKSTQFKTVKKEEVKLIECGCGCDCCPDIKEAVTDETELLDDISDKLTEDGKYPANTKVAFNDLLCWKGELIRWPDYVHITYEDGTKELATRKQIYCGKGGKWLFKRNKPKQVVKQVSCRDDIDQMEVGGMEDFDPKLFSERYVMYRGRYEFSFDPEKLVAEFLAWKKAGGLESRLRKLRQKKRGRKSLSSRTKRRRNRRQNRKNKRTN